MYNFKIGDKVLAEAQIMSKHKDMDGNWVYTVVGCEQIGVIRPTIVTNKVYPISTRTYEDGLREAWETARKIAVDEGDGGLSREEEERIFGNYFTADVFDNYTPQEAAEEIAKWEKKKKIKVGDVLRDNNMREAVVSCVSSLGNIFVIYSDGSCGICDDDIEDYTETGRTIDIAGLLRKIGWAEDA